MARNLGENVSTVYDGLGYSYDKVVFQEGKPILDAELNIAQEYLEILTQKSTGHLPSGWMTYRPYYTSSELSNSFYTQDPDGAKPEVALVNGWPVYVTNTGTPKKHVNKINLNDFNLRSGSRVDGVFLEVWRALIAPSDPETQESNKPLDVTNIGDIRDLYMYNSDVGWAIGSSGIILKTLDGGDRWTSQNPPVSQDFNRVKFSTLDLGYIASSKGFILKTSNGGSTWQSIDTIVNEDFNDLYLISNTKICVVGDNGIVMLSTNGIDFEIVNSTDGVNANLNSVTFSGQSIGWIVGDNGKLLLTNNGGATWSRQRIIDTRTGLEITEDLNSVVFYNMNDGLIVGNNGIILRTSDGGFTWSNLSDRVLSGGSYQTINQVYPIRTNNFNKIFIAREFPINLSLAIYSGSSDYFFDASYEISPPSYPGSFVLRWRGVQDGKSYTRVLPLNLYANAEELTNAINDIISPYLASDASAPEAARQKIRVFEANINYTQKATTFGSSQGDVGTSSQNSQANISFSIEDSAWIVGTNGLVLKSTNSGSKWEIENPGVGLDLYGVHFISDNLGWVTGAEGTVVHYSSGTYAAQDTDLPLLTKGRIYPEGNVESGASDYLEDNMINPQVRVETTKRVQIQYRIRVVEGVDPFNYPEAGLGSEFVYSLGPNDNTNTAGRYSYVNMGSETGDYGLWRSSCHNTVDGYSWAVPMFFVTRRNSAAYNVSSNINGSTVYELGAIRPDGLTYEDVVETDIVDIRRKIVLNSYSHLLEKNFDKLLKNNLRTDLSNRDVEGDQWGTSLLGADSRSGISAITNMLQGGVSSEATLVELQRDVDPSITPTTDELTFGPIDDGLFHNDEAYYKAIVVLNEGGALTETTEEVKGTFEGLGTSTVTFLVDQNFSPTIGTDNVVYRIKVSYLKYNNIGLSRVPIEPLGVKYIPQATENSVYHHGINMLEGTKKLETMDERVPGYPDYITISPAKVVQATKDQEELYKNAAILSENATEFIRSKRKFASQQFKSSLIEYHYFFKTAEATKVVRVPKNLNGYAVYCVREVKNINGSVYRFPSNFTENTALLDRERIEGNWVDDNLILHLDDAYIIPGGSIVEILLEVVSTSTNREDSSLGITVTNVGDNQEGLRTPFTANYNITSKAVEGLYKNMLYPVTSLATLNPNDVVNTITIDFDNASVTELVGATPLGLSSFKTREKDYQMYIWYKSNTKEYYEAVPVSSVKGLGITLEDTFDTSPRNITINIDPSVSLKPGLFLIPMLFKVASLPLLTEESTAIMYYNYRPYQTVSDLPESMMVEVMKAPEHVYVSNLGTGGSSSIKPEPYLSPINHIPVNDSTFTNENMFSNVDDLDFVNFLIDTGFVKMPAILAQPLGEDIVLSSPNNVGDNLGRAYYRECDTNIVFQAENLTKGTPRKVFVPMIARIRSDITSPFLRGELVLLVWSKVYKARLENKTGFFEDGDTEYSPGFFEEAETAIGVYRLTNKPIVRM